MHILYFVATKKTEREEEDDGRIEEIQRNVFRVLEENNFVGESGFYSNCKADWFVIGGRWSGYLQGIKIDEWEEMSKHMEDREELQELWERLGGSGKAPHLRSTYLSLGHEDDTMPLDNELLKALKKQKDFLKNTEIAIIGMGNYIVDEMNMGEFLNKDEKNLIDNYWITVIDYHT